MKLNLATQTKLLRTNRTPWESKLWYYLRGNRFAGLKFKRQVPIDMYVVDFCCQEMKLIVELDGGHHGEAASTSLDIKRQNYLEAKGYKVLRFWNNEVEESIEGLLETIRSSIESSQTSLPAPPHPLRRGERGKIFSPSSGESMQVI